VLVDPAAAREELEAQAALAKVRAEQVER